MASSGEREEVEKATREFETLFSLTVARPSGREGLKKGGEGF